jgi:DNA-binding response OmpR family regulator
VSGGRIFVIDDDHTVLRSVAEVLRAEGYTVACSSNAEDALKAVERQRPDAILLDLMLPGMNGRQFLRALREDCGYTDLPVVIMTAVRGIDTRQTLSMGASDLIEKPFDMDSLLNKVALVLFRAHGERLPRWLPGQIGPGAGDAIILISHDQHKITHLQHLLGSRGSHLVPLIRVTEELPRLARVLDPKAIVIDLHVPGVGGLTALRRLRAEPALQGTRVLLVTDDAKALARAQRELEALAAVGLCAPSDDELLAELASSGASAGTDVV